MLACAVRLLDRGFFRIGSEEYTVQNESYGLATMRKEHVRIEHGEVMVFDYPAKSGQRRVQGIVDPEALAVVAKLRRRRSGGEELLAYKRGRTWHDVRSDDINDYLKDGDRRRLLGQGLPDLERDRAVRRRARRLRRGRAATKTGRKRAMMRAVKEVAHYLGNTPAVCRASYIDPRVFDAYQGGLVIDLERARTDRERAIEEAVLDLIDERERSPMIERIAA